MDFEHFLKCLFLLQDSAPGMKESLSVFVHHHSELSSNSFMEFVTEEMVNKWNIVVLKSEFGWFMFDNVGMNFYQHMFCLSSSNIPFSEIDNAKAALIHYFPYHPNVDVFNVIDFSPHDHDNMLGTLLSVYSRINSKPYPLPNVLTVERNVVALKADISSIIRSNSMAGFPQQYFISIC